MQQFIILDYVNMLFVIQEIIGFNQILGFYETVFIGGEKLLHSEDDTGQSHKQQFPIIML